LAAAVGISAALIGGPAWAQADAWAALFSCGLIIFNGVGMLRASIDEVLDAQAAPELVTEILRAVEAVPGVTSVEKCRVRKSGFAPSRTFTCASPVIAQFDRVTISRTW
jgi:divalent metal cation (Fe/Co/Zn/Cd) transporter